MYRYLFALLVVLVSCRRDKPVAAYTVTGNKPVVTQQTKLRPFYPLHITGDFDGDHKQDTLYECCYSLLRSRNCDSIPDSDYTEFEEVLSWYNREEVEVSVRFSAPGYDTLYLGNAMGLSCLINIGDNNKDGKDEIALSRDNIDYSNMGSCCIYTLCHNKWLVLEQINIHEVIAFSWATDTIPVFTDVPDFLEKHNGEWYYKDYLEEMNDTIADGPGMKKLKLGICK